MVRGERETPLHLLRILPDEDLTITKIEAATNGEPIRSDDSLPMQSGFLFD
jgi:hypothetical protein